MGLFQWQLLQGMLASIITPKFLPRLNSLNYSGDVISYVLNESKLLLLLFWRTPRGGPGPRRRGGEWARRARAGALKSVHPTDLFPFAPGPSCMLRRHRRVSLFLSPAAAPPRVKLHHQTGRSRQKLRIVHYDLLLSVEDLCCFHDHVHIHELTRSTKRSCRREDMGPSVRGCHSRLHL